MNTDAGSDNTIVCSSGEVTIGSIFSSSEGTSDRLKNAPTIKAKKTAISTNTTGSLTINRGYITSGGRDDETGETYGTAVIYANGSGTKNINYAYIYTPLKNKTALAIPGTGNITINDSNLGNGRYDWNGTGADATKPGPCIDLASNATVTVTNSSIMAGPNAGNCVTVNGPGKMIFNGTTSLYASNLLGYTNSAGYLVGASCIAANPDLYSSGFSVTFNSSGDFYCTAQYVVNLYNLPGTINVTKGHFVSRSDNNMFYKSGAVYGSKGTTSGNRTFNYMNDFNSITTTTSISGCYYLGVGV